MGLDTVSQSVELNWKATKTSIVTCLRELNKYIQMVIKKDTSHYWGPHYKKVNSITIELTVYTSGYFVLDLLCVRRTNV